MPNVDAPKGLVPIRYLSGAPYNGACNAYLVQAADATIIGIGDLVDLDGTSGAAGVVVFGQNMEGVPSVTRSAAGGPHQGVVVGFSPDPDNLTRKHRAASTLRIAYVCDDPTVLYEIQEVSGGTALTAAAVGLNANVATVADANTTTGVSTTELDNGTEATTIGLDLKIMGLVRRPDNEIGEHAKWLVMLNDSRLREGVTGV